MQTEKLVNVSASNSSIMYSWCYKLSKLSQHYGKNMIAADQSKLQKSLETGTCTCTCT